MKEFARKQQIGLMLMLLVLFTLSLGIMIRSTGQGIGIGGDATIYITSAHNLITGHGLGLIGPRGEFRLLPYFPPFFSLVLSFFGLLGLDLEQSARWLNMLLFSGLICAAAYATTRLSKSLIWGALAGLLLTFSPVLIPVYSWAMSEPLAFFLGFGGLLMLMVWLDRPRAVNLGLAGLLMGLSFLTRYSAAAFLGTGLVGLWLFGVGRRRKKLIDSALYLACGVLPMLIWLVYDVSQTAAVASRSVESGAGMAQRVAQFWPLMKDVILFWIVPDSWISAPRYPAGLNTLMVIALLAGLAIWAGLVFFWLLRKSEDQFQSGLARLAFLLALFSLAYAAVVAAVYFTTYPPITIGTRMLAPVHIAALWLLVLLAPLSGRLWPRARWLKYVLALGLLLIVAWYGGRSARIVAQNYGQGLGFNSRFWQLSETIQQVKKLPEDQLIVTNEEMAVLYLTGRASYPLAEIYYDRPLNEMTAYGSGEISAEDQAQIAFRDEGAALVLFDSIHAQLEGLYGERTTQRVESLTRGLKQIYRGEDGAIYDQP